MKCFHGLTCFSAGVKPEEEKLVTTNSNTLYEDQAYLKSQTGTALLDKFTHCLLVKCNSEVCFLRLSLNASIIATAHYHSFIHYLDAGYTAYDFDARNTRYNHSWSV